MLDYVMDLERNGVNNFFLHISNIHLIKKKVKAVSFNKNKPLGHRCAHS